MRREADGLAHRGVCRHAGEVQLVGAEPQQRAGGGVGRCSDEPIDEGVAGAPHPGGAVDEVGGEAVVHVGQLGTVQFAVEDEVRVRALVLDPRNTA